MSSPVPEDERADRFELIDGDGGQWLVEVAGEHTCGTGPDGYYGAHEPGCGYVPVGRVADILAALASGVRPTDETREWQPGDYAWLDGEMWRRLSLSPSWTSERGDHHTDAEMIAAGAVLVATAGGPVPSAVRPQDDSEATVTADQLIALVDDERALDEESHYLPDDLGTIRDFLVDAKRYLTDGVR